ncbi:hypothetical protein M9Y10_009876 [Tritrichomonas musculus]|uniref:ribose-phosphate diphosphokinase n=1 Tax=Tritrichomonas musculus TaxID=1915356 RepID=A0ABR2IPL9_9EUKA
MAEVVFLEHENSKYISQSIVEELLDLGLIITHVGIEHSTFPNGEKYYRILIDSDFALLGKTSVYIASLTNDDDILGMYRIGATLAQLGVKRRIFVIPFLTYLSRDRASQSGEVVVSKCSTQMLGSIGNAAEGNVFIFLDPHYNCVLHYFEGPCLCVALDALNTLVRAISQLNYPHDKMVMGSTNLRRANWINRYAVAMGIPVSFCREKPKSSQLEENLVEAVIGDVKDSIVIIYDDIIQSGKTIISAAEQYLKAGASKVVAVATHITCCNEEHILNIINSPLEKIIVTNSHPITSHALVRESEKFMVVDISGVFVQCLYEILPSPEHLHRSSI